MGEVARRLARVGGRLAEALARRRVPLGFVVSAITLGLARPTWDTWTAGLAIALAGEAVRIWAAGHLEKSREVTQSGPYRWMRHPLYAGSTLIAIGVTIASRSLVVAALAGIYMGATITAAVRTEEAFLRGRFGTAYDDYRHARVESEVRRFSLSRALQNREQRAVLGLAAGFALLALKMSLSI